VLRLGKFHTLLAFFFQNTSYVGAETFTYTLTGDVCEQTEIWNGFKCTSSITSLNVTTNSTNLIPHHPANDPGVYMFVLPQMAMNVQFCEHSMSSELSDFFMNMSLKFTIRREGSPSMTLNDAHGECNPGQGPIIPYPRQATYYVLIVNDYENITYNNSGVPIKVTTCPNGKGGPGCNITIYMATAVGNTSFLMTVGETFFFLKSMLTLLYNFGQVRDHKMDHLIQLFMLLRTLYQRWVMQISFPVTTNIAVLLITSDLMSQMALSNFGMLG